MLVGTTVQIVYGFYGHKSDGCWQQLHGPLTPAWFSRGPTHCLRRFERSDCGCKGVSLAYAPLIISCQLFGVGGSRSPAGCGVMAHPPTRRIQNVSVALCCAAVILRAFFVKVQQIGRSERGKGKPFQRARLVSSW